MQEFIKKDSLFWFKAPDLRYTTAAGSSLGLFLNTPLLSCVVEILKPWDQRTDTPPNPQPSAPADHRRSGRWGG